MQGDYASIPSLFTFKNGENSPLCISANKILPDSQNTTNTMQKNLLIDTITTFLGIDTGVKGIFLTLVVITSETF